MRNAFYFAASLAVLFILALTADVLVVDAAALAVDPGALFALEPSALFALEPSALFALEPSALFDGVAFASTPVLVRFTSAFTFEGRDFKKGDEHKFDRAKADSLVNLGIAERLESGAGERTVTLTDEQFARFIGDPSEDEIDAEVQRLQSGDDEQTGRRRNAPNLVGDGAAVDADGVSVTTGERGYVGYGDDRHWARRAVRYIDAIATEADDREKSRRMLAVVIRTTRDLSDDFYRAEEDFANREIKDAVASGRISRKQATRLRAFLEVGEFSRLHTTSTGDTPKAGYLLPKPFLAQLFVIVEQYGLARRVFTAIPMMSKDLDLKNVATKPTAYWVDEGTNGTSTELAFAEGQLLAKKLMILTEWTTEVEEDQAIALLPVFLELAAEEFAKKEDEAGFVGTGTPFTGVLNLSGAQVHTMASTNTTGADVAETDFRSAKQKLSLARRDGARWFMHPSFEDVIAVLEDTNGNRIFQSMISGEAPQRLLGFPIEWSEAYPDVDSVGAGDKFASLGRPGRTLMGQRRGVTADVSREGVIQAGDGTIAYNALQADGAILRITQRLGFATPSAVQDNWVTLQTAAS